MIFYADDDPDDVTMFSDIIRREIGIEAITFTTGQALLDTLTAPPPDPAIIFLDVNMPRKTGLQVLREIRARKPWADVPVVMLTTSDSAQMKAWSLRHGANLYITKSSTYADLVRSLRHAMSIDWRQRRTTEANFVYQP